MRVPSYVYPCTWQMRAKSLDRIAMLSKRVNREMLDSLLKHAKVRLRLGLGLG